MKKLIMACICLGVLASCNIKNSDEYKKMEAERDSLLRQNAMSSTEMAEMMSMINEVEENFNQIKEAEKYLTIESKSKGELPTDSKTRIRDNFDMVNELLKKNKTDIEKLNQRLKGNSKETEGLRKTIERLNAELVERAQTVEELRTIIATRDEQIAQLESNVKELTQGIEGLSTETAAQASTIKEQDKELNTAFYMFGTSKELKEAKVISGGFLASTKILKESIDKSNFVEIDIRQTESIELFSKKAKLLTDHPKDSYEMTKDGDGKMVLKINDYKRFWSLSKFLIVEVN